MPRILIVDDEEKIRDIIKEYLKFEGFDYEEAGNGLEALNILQKEQFDLVLLDVMMPKIDGIKVLKEIRAKGNMPVILLTARAEEYDKLFGFELGADDYVVKPFSPREVMARIKALIARTTPNAGASAKNEIIEFPGLKIDVAGRVLYIDGERAQLTPKEFDLLVYLVRNINIVLTRESILSKVWSYEFFGDDRTVDTHIKMLRNSLGPYRDYISTVWGVGYKFEV
ncbi:MAG: response regulator transcription factor [Oscillospiraceae bacterium]|nr:response regulator transcription factor [Oscillospiraceae bacterium]